MTCACESIHKFPCQFPGETEFFPSDDPKWCRFHLPLRDADGNLSAKGRGVDGWEEDGVELSKFTAEVHARLRAGKAGYALFASPDPRADLRGVVFSAFFTFTGITDTLHVNFSGATFGHDANFSGATFGDWASFAAATFDYCAYFFNATFGDWANFNGATFGDMVQFNSTTFGDWADFNGATFGDRVIFYSVKFRGQANFSIAKSTDAKPNLHHADFSNAIFGGPGKFDDRIFGTDVNFNGAVFHNLVSFHGCTFHPGMSFHQTKFLKTRGHSDDATEKLERSYRTLKLGMENLRARNEEADFFALEMECRRQRGSVPRLERLAASAYKHLSDYGRSVDLPLIWLLILTYAAHYLLYLPIALITCNPGPGARFGFTLEQMFRPFYVWAKNPPGTNNCLLESNPLLIPILASLQSLTTIALLTLFLLALRRRFKMD